MPGLEVGAGIRDAFLDPAGELVDAEHVDVREADVVAGEPGVLGQVGVDRGPEVLQSRLAAFHQGGNLFELDVWKVDFSPLRRWPSPEKLTVR